MKYVFLVLALLSLTGCTSTGYLWYQEPTAGPKARVRFVTTSKGSTDLRVYDDANCTQNGTVWMDLSERSRFGGQLKKLGMPLWNYHENAAKEVYVAANKPIYGMFFGHEYMGSTTYVCAVPFSFTFSENADYEVKYQGGATMCSVSIAQILRAGNNWSLTEVGKFDNKMNDSNRGCLMNQVILLRR